MRFNWQHPNWPNFEFDLSKVQEVLYDYALETSALTGKLNQLPNDLQSDAIIDLMVLEALKTSAIEGEKYNQEDIRSSIRNQLGLSKIPEHIKDPRAAGIAKLMISVRQTIQEPLTQEQLFRWHEMIFLEHFQPERLEVGRWRTSKEPMQIISGAVGREKVHFEAPPSTIVNHEMVRFICWFNKTDPMVAKAKIAGPVRAAIAHLYFESIHPFEDGNGRIGRAISEKALSQELKRPVFLSLSTQIEKGKKEYYKELSQASMNRIDITPWINYFVRIVYQAQLNAKEQISFILQKAQFWAKYSSIVNDRQEKVMSRMFKEGREGFEGGINSQKYMNISGCSKATATRDLAELLRHGCLYRLPGSGRSTRYQLKLPCRENFV